MNNHDLHKAAQELEDTVSPYRLARSLVDALEREQVLAANFIALQDAATDLIHASTEEEAGDAMERIADCSEKQAREVIAKRDLIKQAEAQEKFAMWVEKDLTFDGIFINFDNLLERYRQQAAAL